ncbi:hypothetical protein SELMODRAFT_421285 [Selaginella moellendorffii]|uniref:Peroxiredoxin n=1 Tax=Selaginella moellendorffii TaxID=88036 RepID=D8SES0_SELML|nr:peroxiredoxin Q, chloroplastic [Selaginella moellendorffii]EFJ16918.1 hypothetical protein SELMODRAFT_421285 [Selaginella moellendorffii]|eukprot:XP_002981825.1 peroxiredoxin Q, chloroplastic [Selaginella moellendorffii]
MASCVSRFLGLHCGVGFTPPAPRQFRPVAKISVGQRMPPFTLRDQDGTLVNLLDFKYKPLVIFFYPADNTPACTREACAFRDSYREFKKAGAEVLGISADGQETHKEFRQKHDLPFTLLCDSSDKLRKELEIPGEFFGALPGRETYVLDRKGIVRMVFNDQYAAEQHVEEALKAIRTMTKRGFGG